MAGFFAVTIESQIRGENKTGVVGLNRFPAKIHDMRPAWASVEGSVRIAFLEAFDQEGNGSGRWLPLSKRYGEWKARHFPGKKILQLTGRLRGSLVSGGHSDSITRKTKNYLFIGSKVPYAKYHQQGTTRMVARPPISLTTKQRGDIGRMIHKAMKQYLSTSSTSNVKV